MQKQLFRLNFGKVENILIGRSFSMSRKSSQSQVRLTHQSVKEMSNRLARVQITPKRRFSAKNFSIDHLVQSIKTGQFKRIVVLAGAGISTPSGIPDFRTPGTGLYDNLQRYNIPYPEAIFELSYFHRNPNPFFHLAKELYPGRYFPNVIHHFIRYLNDLNILHRVYTQNIDGLERMVGIPVEKIVEAHGTFLTATCLRCRQKYQCEEIREAIFADQVPKCSKTSRCSGVVKPDIVFFGEDLPRRFQLYLQDLPICDCCIVMGTSLAVYPFAEIVDSTNRSTPRLLINRQIVGTFLSPRPYDVTMTGDLEFNVKEVLTKLDAIESVMAQMKQENGEQEKNRKLSKPKSASTNRTTNDDRLKVAEHFLEQRRKYSSISRVPLQTLPVPTQPVFNDSTRMFIERHNNAVILQRRRSKSAAPIINTRPSSSSSSSSSAESLNSSLSETDLSPFAFKQSTNPRRRFLKKPTAIPISRLKGNPLLNATLRSDS